MNAKNRRGVSPVIATVILVAVAITISIAVAYWMGGIAGQYTKFEKVEIQSAVCTRDATGWTVVCTLKNSGSAPATLNGVYVNDVPVKDANYAKTTYVTNEVSTDVPASKEKTIDVGLSSTINVWIDDGYPQTPGPYTAGTTINIKFHSAGGLDYIKVVTLV